MSGVPRRLSSVQRAAARTEGGIAKAVKKTLLKLLSRHEFVGNKTLKEALALALKTSDVEVYKEHNAAWEVVVNGRYVYVGMRITFDQVFKDAFNGEAHEEMTEVIRSAPSFVAELLGLRRGQASKERAHKKRVKGEFTCECGNGWTSFHAYIDSATGEPWRGRTQLCKDCDKRGEMETWSELTFGGGFGGRKQKSHRMDLCEWCSHWLLGGDHSQMAFFVQPSTLTTALENDTEIEVSKAKYVVTQKTNAEVITLQISQCDEVLGDLNDDDSDSQSGDREVEYKEYKLGTLIFTPFVNITGEMA